MANRRKPAVAAGKPAFWVGLGASAGGLDALRLVVRNLPEGLAATYIVAQHMAPSHKSLLADILGRDTHLAVLDAEDGVAPKAGTVYVTPPNVDIAIDEGRLRLSAPSGGHQPKPSIDLFFSSLAREAGNRAVAIVLSGTGADGARGIAAVHEAGGLVIAQSEASARHAAMPLAAMQTGLVDLVLPPEEIGAQMGRIAADPREIEALRAPISDEGPIAELLRLLHERTGVDFRSYKRATLERRIGRRIAATRADSLARYVEIARSSPTEIEALFRDMLISVTSFFRDPAEYEALRSHIDGLVARRKDGAIRVWVAGCATGEEAYTLAILFLEAIRGQKGSAARLQIFATDIDAAAIETARTGLYAPAALAHVPAALIRRYFESGPAGHAVKTAVRDKIVFSYHDLAQDPPFLNIDLISCRNLLIYFQPRLQAEVFSRFHYSLDPGGLLFLGKSEAVSASPSLFRPAGPAKHIFVRREAPDPGRPRTSARRATAAAGERAEPPARGEPAPAQFAALVRAIGPDAILVDRSLTVLAVFGDLSRQVPDPDTAPGRSLRTVLRAPFRQEATTALRSALRSGIPVTGAARDVAGQPGLRARIQVYPLAQEGSAPNEALVVFSHWSVGAAETGERTGMALRAQVDALDMELSIATTNLQQMSEQLEASNEELQALNEELQASNEELQSTNEELETSNEELQSANEELSTVNEELSVSTQELALVNRNLANILDSISIPLMVVDRGLTITHMSRAAEAHFRIQRTQRMPHIARCAARPGYPDLASAVAEAIRTGEERTFYVEDGEDSAVLRIVPHVDTDGALVGAIVLVSDNTRALRDARNEMQLILDNVPASIMMRDAAGTIVKANAAFRRMLAPDGAEIEGTCYYDYFAPQTGEMLRKLDLQALETGKPSIGVVLRKAYRDRRERWMRVSCIPSAETRRGERYLYILEQDITDRMDAELRLAASEARLRQAIKATGIGFGEWKAADGRTYWSPRVFELLGLSVPYDGGAPDDLDAFVHPDDLPELVARRTAHLDGFAPFEAEFRLRRIDGSHIWVRSYGQARWDTDSIASEFVYTLEDITAEKEARIALETQKDQLELAAALAGVGHWVADVDADTITWSDQMYVIHGVDKASFSPTLAKTRAFYHPDDRHRIPSPSEVAALRGDPFDFEARIVRADGEIRTVRVAGLPRIDAAGQVRGTFGIHVDVTDFRERESRMASALAELARSNEELNRFSYVCSHDMKEPVRMIESMASLLISPEFEADETIRRELLSRISTNTTRLRSIIDSLLAYSRIDAKVTTGPVDLNAVMEEILENLAIAIGTQHATIEIGRLPTVHGAGVHFTQLFQNLIGNALKYTDKPNPLVRLTVEDLGDEWVFTLADNGPGIPEESRREVFNLFSRLRRRDEVEGTGLGLSIAQRIVAQYGGTIRCEESTLGGAAFVITLPKAGGGHDQPAH